MTAAAAEFDNLSKQYAVGWFGRRFQPALRGVSFRIESGDVFGLLGPNRAGKTTLVKVLLSLCRPSGGRVVRLGRGLADRSTLGRVGYMHENHAFPRYLSATQLLWFYGSLALVPEPDLHRRVPALLERVGLDDRCHEPIGQFSKGMIQRLGLAQALVNDPELLVLDEPTEGLDLSGRRLLREVVAELRGRGRTVLLVSHVVSEVEQLCNRVAVLVEGRLVFSGSMGQLVNDPPSGQRRSLEQVLHELYHGTTADAVA